MARSNDLKLSLNKSNYFRDFPVLSAFILSTPARPASHSWRKEAAVNEYNHKIFERMAALLLSLANLAECAGARCLPVRCLVLWILRPAEAVARAYAIEVAGSPILLEGFRWTDDMPDCQRSDETADGALSLARDFRALAAVFLWLAQWARLATSNALRCLILLQPSVVAERLPSLTALFSRRIDTS